MDLEITDETRSQTTRCPHDFACLRDAEEQVCPEETYLEGNGLFVRWQEAWSGPYHLAFGDSHICHCPTRIAVYRPSGT
jgi:hypothetical protein